MVFISRDDGNHHSCPLKDLGSDTCHSWPFRVMASLFYLPCVAVSTNASPMLFLNHHLPLCEQNSPLTRCELSRIGHSHMCICPLCRKPSFLFFPSWQSLTMRMSKHGPPRDLLVKAKTGTGKTLVFLVPVIEARIKAIEKARVDALEKMVANRILASLRMPGAHMHETQSAQSSSAPPASSRRRFPTKRPSSRTGIRDSKSSCSPAVRAKDFTFATSSVAVTTSSSLHPVGYVTFWRMTTSPKRLRLRHRCVLVISTIF